MIPGWLLEKAEQDFRWDGSGPVQTLKGGDIALHFKNGETREVSFVTHPPRWHLKGGGYGGYRGWYHGDSKGEYYAEHDVWDLSDPAVLAEASTLSDHLIEWRSRQRRRLRNHGVRRRPRLLQIQGHPASPDVLRYG